ncbi:ribosome silencing factor [Roseimaritima sediminicola]|uniref:ribosome silencing factor n=1 Tax=Roseimaritima sediminicola TaxID=2662066 RepID=UPI0036F19A1C
MTEPDQQADQPDPSEQPEISGQADSAEQPETAEQPESPRSLRPHGTERSLQLATAAAKVAIDNRGQSVQVLDVCKQTALFDYFVIATGTSRRQLHAISEEIDDVLEKQLDDQRLNIEGYDESRWIVLDYGSVVVHLFDEETRSYYDLESLWADAKVVPLADLGLSDPSQADS